MADEKEPADAEVAAEKQRISDDWLAVICGGLVLAVAFLAVWSNSTVEGSDAGNATVAANNPLKPWLGKPATWELYAADSLISKDDAGEVDYGTLFSLLGAFGVLGVLLTVAVGYRDGSKKIAPFALGFVGIFILATLAYIMAAQAMVKAYNLEYALWALLVGLIISNTIGTPKLLRPAVQTEFYIKTGLVLLGAGVLLSRLIVLGIPGIFVAWVVTPIVLISTYFFGQKVLKMESKSLNMVIAADMSVCGVSAAIASAAACKAKKEELSLAIGMSLSFTVIMMIVMPLFIRVVDMNPVVGAAWMGGTIDSTGAVAAAGSVLGDRGEKIASAVKMIQNILIGVSAFGIAVYWVSAVEKSPGEGRPRVSEIWKRFPKFVLGFIGASLVFSAVHAMLPGGPELVSSMVKGTTKTLRGWLFCLAFVCIGLETRFADMLPYMRGGKPLVLYICGQTLNLVLTLLMAWLMFEVVFGESIAELFPEDS